MSECERCQELFDRYVANQLTTQEKNFMEEHLAGCDACAEALKPWQSVEQMLAVWAEEEIEPPADFRAKLFEKLETQSSSITPVAARKSWFRQNKRKLMPLAVAAVLMLTFMPTIWQNIRASEPLSPMQEEHLLAKSHGISDQSKQNIPDSAQKPTADKAIPDATPRDTATPGQWIQPGENAPTQSPDNSSAKINQNPTNAETPPAVVLPQAAKNESPIPQLAQAPAPAAYTASPRSAMPAEGDIDWAGYKTSAEQELKQVQEQLAQLQDTNKQQLTSESMDQIKNLERVIRQIEARLKAIEDQDVSKVEASFDVE